MIRRESENALSRFAGAMLRPIGPFGKPKTSTHGEFPPMLWMSSCDFSESGNRSPRSPACLPERRRRKNGDRHLARSLLHEPARSQSPFFHYEQQPQAKTTTPVWTDSHLPQKPDSGIFEPPRANVKLVHRKSKNNFHHPTEDSRLAGSATLGTEGLVDGQPSRRRRPTNCRPRQSSCRPRRSRATCNASAVKRPVWPCRCPSGNARLKRSEWLPKWSLVIHPETW